MSLLVITTFFNWVKSERKIENFKRFEKQFENFKNSRLVVVELSYESTFAVTQADNPNHIQIHYRGQPLFHKENLMNIAVRKFPSDYYCFCDADIIFGQDDWDIKTIEKLSVDKPVIMQPFSLLLDLDEDGFVISMEESFCSPNLTNGQPGLVWAMNRLAYEQIGGLYEKMIIGSGDTLLANALVGKHMKETHGDYLTESFQEDIARYIQKFKEPTPITKDFLPGTITHLYHGKRRKRRYYKRFELFKDLNPSDLYKDKNGVIHSRKRLGTENYFVAREEA